MICNEEQKRYDSKNSPREKRKTAAKIPRNGRIRDVHHDSEIKEDFVEVEAEEALEQFEVEIPVEASNLEDSVLVRVEKIEENEEVYEEYLEPDFSHIIEDNLEFEVNGEGGKLQKTNRMKLCSGEEGNSKIFLD